MVHTSLLHWFFIGLTLQPLAWYSFVHCIGTSHWLLLPIGNLTLDLIGLEPSPTDQQSYPNVDCFTLDRTLVG